MSIISGLLTSVVSTSIFVTITLVTQRKIYGSLGKKEDLERLDNVLGKLILSEKNLGYHGREEDILYIGKIPFFKLIARYYFVLDDEYTRYRVPIYSLYHRKIKYYYKLCKKYSIDYESFGPYLAKANYDNSLDSIISSFVITQIANNKNNKK